MRYTWTDNTPLDQAKSVLKRMTDAVSVLLGTTAAADKLDADTLRDAAVTEMAASAFPAINSLIAFLSDDGMISHGALAIDATPEKFKTTATLVYTIAGVSYIKAPATALVFTAAHPVTASKFGAILVQIDALGAVTTKISGATQTTTQAHNTAAIAIAALPEADENNIPIGYIVIEADSGGWTAITDDLTDASDLVTADFVDSPAVKTLPAAI